ncbi:DUF339-domain-containing protein [Hypoxylon sp. FL0543]|nr:DUF339-domain-containing protein [Hypoxylon sp. FL0543]
MASAASVIPRSVLRSAQRPAAARMSLLRRPLSSTRALRAGVSAPNPPPMEPHKQRGQAAADIGVGELEGTEFRIEPMRRTGEDDATMRARLVYQSRKRGTLEADLLLSTFADAYLPKMTREQMAQYDRFLDENDWDIYYWATQEPPSSDATAISASETSSSSSSSSTTTRPPSIATSDTSSADYAGGAEAAISEASGPPSSSANSRLAEPISTGGSARTGDAGEGKEAPASAAEEEGEQPYHMRRETGEWAQTVGTFKPAYRPVPQRWRDSEILRLLRDHVKARAKESGGMAFMPPLREP